jgi:hypothetical protein
MRSGVMNWGWGWYKVLEGHANGAGAGQHSAQQLAGNHGRHSVEAGVLEGVHVVPGGWGG